MKRRSIVRSVLCIILGLIIMLIVSISVNWRYMSMDMIRTKKSNSYYIHSPGNMSSTPTTSQSQDIFSSTDSLNSIESPSNLASSQNSLTSQTLQSTSVKTGQDRDEISLLLGNSRSNMRQEETMKTETNSQMSSQFDGSSKETAPDLDNESNTSCENTPLRDYLKDSNILFPSDFICSHRNDGWEYHLPPPTMNTTRAVRLWKKRHSLIKDFAYEQDNYIHNDNSKYIVFWPIFAGIGNNLAVLTETLLIALMSKRKLLIYNWDTLPNYFYFPFQYAFINRKVWLDEPDTLFVRKPNHCKFNSVDACYGKVKAKFIVMRSTCMTTQNLIKHRETKGFFGDHGIMPRILLSSNEEAHLIYHFLYTELMTPQDYVMKQIETYKKDMGWDEYFIIGIHVRTGGVADEPIKWGKFLNQQDIDMFKVYASKLTSIYNSDEDFVPKKRGTGQLGMQRIRDKRKAGLPVKWYLISDQESIKREFEDDFGSMILTTHCDLKHTNRFSSEKDSSFTCALIESYMLSFCDMMILTKRSTYGYFAQHKTHAPFITVDAGTYDDWIKKSPERKDQIFVNFWNANDI